MPPNNVAAKAPQSPVAPRPQSGHQVTYAKFNMFSIMQASLSASPAAASPPAVARHLHCASKKNVGMRGSLGKRASPMHTAPAQACRSHASAQRARTGNHRQTTKLTTSAVYCYETEIKTRTVQLRYAVGIHTSFTVIQLYTAVF